jgi:hypothetical protein
MEEKLSAEDLQKRDSLFGRGGAAAAAEPGKAGSSSRNSPSKDGGGRVRRPRSKSQVDDVLGTDTIEECVQSLCFAASMVVGWN